MSAKSLDLTIAKILNTTARSFNEPTNSSQKTHQDKDYWSQLLGFTQNHPKAKKSSVIRRRGTDATGLALQNLHDED